MDSKEEYMSLYDYRKRPDVDNIGQKVYKYAKHKGVKTEIRKLQNGQKVVTYPKSFLEEYFLIRMVLQAPLKYFK